MWYCYPKTDCEDVDTGLDKDFVYTVLYKEDDGFLKCNCRSFGSRGLLCAHILSLRSTKTLRRGLEAADIALSSQARLLKFRRCEMNPWKRASESASGTGVNRNGANQVNEDINEVKFIEDTKRQLTLRIEFIDKLCSISLKLFRRFKRSTKVSHFMVAYKNTYDVAISRGRRQKEVENIENLFLILTRLPISILIAAQLVEDPAVRILHFIEPYRAIGAGGKDRETGKFPREEVKRTEELEERVNP
ncbi:hypothetical protein M9H77_03910 [Catharanthus roseus]|uniref:Uncharacterized protein n=1 Tax=Catharanthus roseus TaxID=4058 RepID=A0ACC0CCT7_CATRO|nr:hypothetical protein M9H77_03910 [Catharanthus roseus]